MPTITRCWTKIGQQKLILTPGVRPQKRWNWGAVDVATGQTVHIVHERRNKVGFRRLLAALARHFRLGERPQRRLVLFVDNDKAYDAKAVRQLLANSAHRVQLEWLPPYSPQLNPQEDVWRHMRRHVTHNHYFEQVDELLTALEHFHQELEADTAQVLRLLKPWLKRLRS